MLVHNEYFYTVQSDNDAQRLLNGGEPWPSSASRAALGDGIYAWGNRTSAEQYLEAIQKKGASAKILKFQVDVKSLKTLIIDALPQNEIDDFMNSFSRLYNGTPNHGYEYIQRGTKFGVEHYFSYTIYDLIEFIL